MKITQIERLKTDFQQPVDPMSLQSGLSTALGDEDILEIVELNAGLFNNTYHVRTKQAQYILKVAPSAQADVFYNERNLMQRERSLSKTLQAVSDLIPAYLVFFQIDQRDAFLQPFIQGVLWNDVIDSLTEAENEKLWFQLGRFANKIHSFEGATFGYPNPFKRFANCADFITDNVKGMSEDAIRLGVYHPEVETYRSLLPYFHKDLNHSTQANLLHGDLWPRNVIIEGEGEDIRIKAILDAERAFWGDPISDWVLIMYGVPKAFWQGYGHNPVAQANPAVVELYCGMYFMLNIIEATRFAVSDQQPRKLLAQVNQRLERLKPDYRSL